MTDTPDNFDAIAEAKIAEIKADLYNDRQLLIEAVFESELGEDVLTCLLQFGAGSTHDLFTNDQKCTLVATTTLIRVVDYYLQTEAENRFNAMGKEEQLSRPEDDD